MTPRTVRNATLIAILLGAVATAGLLVHASGSPGALLSGFALWVLLPYAVLYGGMRWLVRGRGTAAVVLVAAIGAAAFGLWCYFDAFFSHLSSTSGLIFIFVPLYQLMAVGIVFGVVTLVRVFNRRKVEPADP